MQCIDRTRAFVQYMVPKDEYIGKMHRRNNVYNVYLCNFFRSKQLRGALFKYIMCFYSHRHFGFFFCNWVIVGVI